MHLSYNHTRTNYSHAHKANAYCHRHWSLRPASQQVLSLSLLHLFVRWTTVSDPRSRKTVSNQSRQFLICCSTNSCRNGAVIPLRKGFETVVTSAGVTISTNQSEPDMLLINFAIETI